MVGGGEVGEEEVGGEKVEEEELVGGEINDCGAKRDGGGRASEGVGV